ncbi:MAG: biotin--[acetyl-CoA-carboxylase] ligase [Firmicutes bacterium]|nr:biotin--[acetyl-CoA-carboxylase] ligase [Bacillota bacterium]
MRTSDTRYQILEILRQNSSCFVSGQELADSLKISRAAVWKAVQQLKNEGFEILSTQNRGYQLQSAEDVLSSGSISSYLKHKNLQVKVFKQIDSTNTALKQLAEQGAPEGTILVAEEQTAGRGRMGRSFYSPSGSGIYLSLLVRPKMSAASSTSLTAAAAVAVCEAIEAITKKKTQIKWVNDVYVDQKKVCGILTEGAMDFESGSLQYAIVGIGINLRDPDGGFPVDIKAVAGSLGETNSDIRSRLCAEVIDRLMDFYEHLEEKSFYEGYKKRSFLLGQKVNIISGGNYTDASPNSAPGKEPVSALVLDVEPDFSLKVSLPDGSIRLLNSGEVSVRPDTAC